MAVEVAWLRWAATACLAITAWTMPLSTSGILRVTLRGDGRFETGRLVATHLVGAGLPAIDAGETAHGVVRTLSRQDFGARGVKISADGILSR